MSFNSGSIKLGRFFMVAWLAFFIYPIEVILTQPFAGQDKAIALGLLLSSGLVWAWFWTRVLGGPDERFRWIAYGLTAATIGVFTLMTPAKYGTLFVCITVVAGAAFPWRLAVPLVVASALVGGIFDLIRGTEPLQATGEVLNDAIVGLAAVAGRLLVQANQQLSLAREQIARLAVGEERLRFARDLHDLLGHSLSVIALKSELAGRLIKSTPGLAAHEIEDIEKVTREALREVREAVSGYRQPTLAAELVGAREALTAAGIEFRSEQSEAALPPAIESVIAWTVREGVTNVMRHSQAKRCAIRISNQDGRVTVDVVDDGQGGMPKAGSGLRGLEERVRERGGIMTAEPLAHDGFRLRVTLPLPKPGVPADRVPA
ncbi:MAG TPA: sensor histidine kinase [Candidatus Dormibacteraeota bacterium]